MPEVEGAKTVRWIPWVLALGAILALPLPILAADPAGEVRIPRVDRPPVLDEFLDMQPPADLAAQMTKINGFVQQSPEDGEPASQRTDVYMGYDDLQLYFVFVAHDTEPRLMRSHMSRRENMFGDETVEVQLDTFNDQRRAFSFLTNPLGVQWDAIWTEGQGFDSSWDTVWQSRGKLTDSGYVVLMAIPFKSLRFPPSEVQTWGIVFVRDIPRNNEVSFWPRVSNRIEGRLNQEATLTGLRDISPGRNIQIIPYATASRTRSLDEASGTFDRDSLDPDGGVDAKFVIKDSLSLDVTVNPDFNQVESDAPQVTVNQRFEVFFPEKRPFFLENANYFNTPFNLLFTRRIVEPRIGARVTGKVGNYSLGALIIDDEAPPEVTRELDPSFSGARARFSVLRASRDISDQSNIGILYTDRQFDNGSNRVGGVDGRFKIGANWDARFQAVRSETEEPEVAGSLDFTGERLEDEAYSLVFNRSGRKFGTHIHYQEVGRDFRTAAGFMPRTDFRDFHNSTSYTFRPESKHLVAWGPSLYGQVITDIDGTRTDWTINPEFDWEFRRQTRIELIHRRGRELLRAGLDGVTTTTDYRRVSTELEFRTRFVSAVELEVELSNGVGINFAPPSTSDPVPAEINRAAVELTLRPSQGLVIDNTYLMTRLSDPDLGGRIFTNQIARSRFNYQLNRRLSLRMILQYDSLRANEARTSLSGEKNFNVDLLGTYLINPWTAIYVGYLSRYENPDPLDTGFPPDPDPFRNTQRQLFVKATYLFRL